MTVNHPHWGTMCEICFNQVTPDTAAVDTDGQRWDVCAGDCARQAGIVEAPIGTVHHHEGDDLAHHQR